MERPIQPWHKASSLAEPHRRRCKLRDTFPNRILKILFHLFYPGWTEKQRYLLLLQTQGFLTMHNTYGQNILEICLIFKRVQKTAHFRPKSRDLKLCFQLSIEYFSLNKKGHTKNLGCFRKPWASALTWMCWKNVLAQKLLLQRHLSKKHVVPLTFFEKSVFLEKGKFLHHHSV